MGMVVQGCLAVRGRSAGRNRHQYPEESDSPRLPVRTGGGPKYLLTMFPSFLAEAYGQAVRQDRGSARYASAEALRLSETNLESVTGKRSCIGSKGSLRSHSPSVQSLSVQASRRKSKRAAKDKGQKSEIANPQSLTPNPQAEAEACFLKAIEIARRQEAKSLELRAVISLARLWQTSRQAGRSSP